jgi:hypothetical protein
MGPHRPWLRVGRNALATLGALLCSIVIAARTGDRRPVDRPTVEPSPSDTWPASSPSAPSAHAATATSAVTPPSPAPTPSLRASDASESRRAVRHRGILAALDRGDENERSMQRALDAIATLTARPPPDNERNADAPWFTDLGTARIANAANSGDATCRCDDSLGLPPVRRHKSQNRDH